MKKLVCALALLAAPGAANAMNVATFLAKAEALQKKGAMALFSSDIGLLKKEFGSAGKQLRAEQLAAQKAGRKPAYCLPPKAAVNSNELLAHFRSIPPARRGISVKTALGEMMAKKYPCPS